MTAQERQDGRLKDHSDKTTVYEGFACPHCGSGGPDYSDVTNDGGNCAHCGVGLETLAVYTHELGPEQLNRAVFIIAEEDGYQAASEIATVFRDRGITVISTQNMVTNSRFGGDVTNITSMIRNTAMTLIIPSPRMDFTSAGRYAVRRTKFTDYDDRVIPVYAVPESFLMNNRDLDYYTSCNWTGTQDTGRTGGLAFDRERLVEYVTQTIADMGPAQS